MKKISNEIQTDFIDEHGRVKAIIAVLNRGKVPMLVGETGSGKTFLIREISKAADWPQETINCNSATTVGHLLGKWQFGSEGKPVWVDGILTRCMKAGKICILEEANGLRADVWLSMYSAMDLRREVVLDAKDGELVKAHPDFRLVLTGNLNYRGTERFNPAIRNRIAAYVNIPYLSSNLESRFLADKTKLPLKETEKIANVASAIRSQTKKTGYEPLSTRCLEEWCTMIQEDKFSPMDAAGYTIIPTLSDDPQEQLQIHKFIRDIMNTKKREDDD